MSIPEAGGRAPWVGGGVGWGGGLEHGCLREQVCPASSDLSHSELPIVISALCLSGNGHGPQSPSVNIYSFLKLKGCLCGPTPAQKNRGHALQRSEAALADSQGQGDWQMKAQLRLPALPTCLTLPEHPSFVSSDLVLELWALLTLRSVSSENT